MVLLDTSRDRKPKRDYNWVFIALMALFVVMVVSMSVDNIFGRLGFETKTSLKVKNTEQKNLIAALQEEVKELQKDQLFEKSMMEALHTNTITHKENEQLLEQLWGDVETKRDKEMAMIEQDTSLSPPQRNRAVAKAQIDSLWELSCQIEACGESV